MTDARTILSNLRRPRLLIQAARFALDDYRRDRDLRRILPVPTSQERTVRQLLAEEERLESDRAAGSLSYAVARHIDVLVALMAEVRLLSRGIAV